ncbi:MBL fold metallo-hydrolase [Candidatus Bathyarchaeota archaeon]|nr:MBL fold metallo-hydrolase [Candidatus Bathyarchaeota archaeon]
MSEVKIITQKHFVEVNSYLIKTNSGFFLIDTGLPKKRSNLIQILEANGCLPGDLKLIIVTHGHFDHNGNTAYLSRKYGVRIAMHSKDSVMAESGDMFIEMKGLMVNAIRFLLPLIGMNKYETFKPDIIFDNENDLSDYGLTARVFHLPGHSQGSVGVLTSNGDFFCGDIFTNTGKPEKNSLIDNLLDYEESINKIKSKNINSIYPGHGKPFKINELVF